MVLGLSFDTVEDNRRFAEAQGFGYRLLSDPDRTTGSTYHVLRDPTERYAGMPLRISHLIDPGGVIRRSYVVTNVAGFAAEVLADLAELHPG